jgi:hypothetical protein
MNLLRSQAIKLRLKGKSYNEINVELGIPKSTLSGWLKDLVLPDAARSRLSGRVHQGVQNSLVKRNKLQTKEAKERNSNIRNSAKSEIKELSLDDLRLVGTALYWAEGYKRLKVKDGQERTWHTISFVNSDPEMVSTFVRFLREVMDIPASSIRLYMRLYPHINEVEAKKFWMECTGLPSEQFFKTTNLVSGASKGMRPYNRLPWGTLQIEVCNTAQFHRLMGWIEGMKAGF